MYRALQIMEMLYFLPPAELLLVHAMLEVIQEKTLQKNQLLEVAEKVKWENKGVYLVKWVVQRLGGGELRK